MKVKFVIVSSDQRFYMPNVQSQSVEGFQIEAVYVKNNRERLASVYNRELSEDYDVIAFIHGDVRFNISKTLQRLSQVKDKYDLIGAAGSSFVIPSTHPFSWFLCGKAGMKKYGRGLYGAVKHTTNNIPIVYNVGQPKLTDHPALLIDGLFIAFTKRAIQAGLKFDQDLGLFDFYDADISMSALFQHKLRTGVMIVPDLEHGSPGQRILSNAYQKIEAKFKEKWAKYLITQFALKEM